VPYPHHADRHQERNARQLGAGVRIVDERDLDEERARELARLCGQAGIEPRTAMHAALEGCVPPEAARRIWGELHALACAAARFHPGA
jgi:UDP-N-acetylglucosamine:LPS N-acetylglucosamine transferase